MSLWDPPLVEERLYAQEIGFRILDYVKDYNVHELARQIDSDAVAMIKEIKAILDDLTLDDPECFLRIDAIVRTFHFHNLVTERHWELE